MPHSCSALLIFYIGLCVPVPVHFVWGTLDGTGTVVGCLPRALGACTVINATRPCAVCYVGNTTCQFTPDENHKPRRLERNSVLPALLTCPSSAPAAGKQSSCDCAPFSPECYSPFGIPGINADS